MGFAYPFVSVLSQQQHRAEGQILHLKAFLKQLGTVFPPDSTDQYNELYQAVYNDSLLNSKMFFLAPVCVTPGDSKVCKVASPARLALGGTL